MKCPYWLDEKLKCRLYDLKQSGNYCSGNIWLSKLIDSSYRCLHVGDITDEDVKRKGLSDLGGRIKEFNNQYSSYASWGVDCYKMRKTGNKYMTLGLTSTILSSWLLPPSLTAMSVLGGLLIITGVVINGCVKKGQKEYEIIKSLEEKLKDGEIQDE